jgi:hypothetical protein
MENIAFAMTTQRNFAPKSWLAYGIIGFYGISLLASLRFMWDIRHPKTE